ncbi:hemolysin III family protein [Pseudohongiella sp. SYSU M77423]|uniref:PAQR family membrane homeostasis protein TrhA n=1 Tax=Pseudohongiella sp. SYSU M77423 TaxID=3042312 RepID=UPI000C4EB5C3|nr:hemolysin III family protein [Pseudohongiella sp. SYSU M77423]MAY56222.1 hemolysin D [Gammaproteobacteria bacterium]MBJ54847.1 hemolysin D [Gammaproteobacteria bacterium]MDH7942513.1 hemolysin III family protein [Pseudohongiella sp. SYSU M77423]HBN13757.1 hemolysin D [Pseudohongiella sp.]|tara:strand:- start:413 stop:1051 length:639 start_codon:yes stop_codon:yes gene_type:complete
MTGYPRYSQTEERLNVSLHALGFLLSVAALVALLLRASALDSMLVLVSFGLFGVSLVLLYAISTLYHSTQNPRLRSRLRVADHASIYVLIAGTYSPFALIVMQGSIGWTIFAVSWSMALAGIVLKLFYTGRFSLLSTLLYVFMGWIILFAIQPLLASFGGPGLSWLIAGGVSYTLGAVLYSIRRLPLNHAIFHLFVLLGSCCHFVAVYFYVA